MNLDRMKRNAIRTGVGIGAGVVLLSALGFKLWQAKQTKDQVVMRVVDQMLTTAHFQPKDIDDELSVEVFETFLEQVDGGKRFLTDADIQQLSTYKSRLDDQFNASSSQFFNEAFGIMQQRFAEAQAYYQEVLAQPFDFTLMEDFETNIEDETWAMDKVELKDRWRKQLKLRVLARLYDAREDGTDEEPFEFTKAEVKAREDELEAHDEWFKNLMDMERVEWFGAYMNAFTLQFDPHTEYYPPRQKEDFEIRMTGQLEGIGAQLRVRGEYVTVSSIVTGSASWRQGDLEEGDKITRVAQEGEEPLNVVGMSINRVVDMIRGPKGTVVTLTVKKKDGTTQEISIERDIVELEATFARSVVMGDDQKVGYIRLPKFYVDFYGDQNHNCAEDVEAEIEKLKEEGVEGIIFDLRNNGGGSLQAAIDIVGLFIDRGPVVQVKDRRDGTQRYSDNNSGAAYDGPLVVMVNEGSASASEIVAAAIQDYGRGVIIGPSSTHGKGTVQNVWDIDRVVGDNFPEEKPLGALKVTTQKFYRVNGSTTQLQGVIPDVVLPASFMYIDWGEKEYETALPVDEIAPASYARSSQYDATAWERAAQNSAARVDTSAKFERIEAYATWLEAQQEEVDIPLNWDAYVANEDARKVEAEQWDKLMRLPDSVSIYPLPSDLVEFKTDTAMGEDYRRWYRGLSHDLYLREALNVLGDLK